jgi:5'-3' exonuclease
MRYVVIFFDNDKNIVKAHEIEKYPKIKDLVYLFKLLEKTELKEIEELSMDILTEEQFKQINTQ